MPNKLKYCIQEHNASHLHWDLRLEVNGVAKSWAVPKEPILKEGVKRLAILVKDHSIEYMDFKGDLGDGYGKGSVKIWDEGYWIPESVEEKKIVGEIKGKKLKGKYSLINFKEKNWLLFKAKK